MVTYYLNSGGNANTRLGDGALSTDAPKPMPLMDFSMIR